MHIQYTECFKCIHNWSHISNKAQIQTVHTLFAAIHDIGHSIIPFSHVLPSGKSFKPVGQAQERLWVFNRQRWVHPPLRVELQGF